MKEIVLLTGASGGFGELITKTLSKKGYVVYASMRDINKKNKHKAEELSKLQNVYPIELDVTNDQSVKKAVEQILKKENKIDILINNAGVGNHGVTEGFTSDQVKQLFDINVIGSFRVAKEVLPHMRKQKSGLIIQISSQLGRVVIPLMGLYSGTKFAVEAINESLADEVKDLGIDVCIVQPGGYPTDFARNSINAKENLVNVYGQQVKKSIDGMNHYMEFLKSQNAPNPQEVADAVAEVIEAGHGKRPRRKIAGQSMGTHLINEVSQEVQSEALKRFS